jgi:ABC-type branched-subunit amino acid transport system permease subunit
MEQIAEPVGAVAATFIFGALVLKLVDFLKYLKNGDSNGIVTLLLGWAAGVAAVQIISWTQWNDEIKIGDETLNSLSFASQIVLGFVATSVAAVVYDFKKAVDNSDSAKTPNLVGD